MADWIIERLAGHHDRTHFDCGKPSLSEWIKKYAGQNEARDVSRTFVAVLSDTSRVFGYYCLSNSQITNDALPIKDGKGLSRNQPVPTALIGRLAVDRNSQGKKLGEFLLLDALARTERLSKEMGVVAVVVDALDEQAKAFYLKYGFEELLDDPLHLFITLKVVRKLGLNSPRTLPR